MATIANLNVILGLEDQLTKGLEKSRRNLDSWGKSFQRIGAGLTAGVTTPILGMAAISVKAASDVQESLSAVEQVYDSAAATVIQRADEAAKAVGLSKEEYLSTAAVLGVYGDTLGLTSAETADFSNSLIGAAADLGSFYNANTPEVLGAMQAALRGEFDPLERFGIMMNQASLEAYALEQGIWDGSGALTAQQRILAAQGFILDNMDDATGDFARTSGGLANTQKILRAQLKNVSAQMGQVLLPTVTRLAKAFGDLLTRFQGISPEWQRWIVLIALVVAGIGPLLIVLGTFLTLLPAIGAALAVLTGPIGLVIAAIALLTAAYIGNWWGFRDAVNGVAGAIVDVVTWFGNLTAVQVTVDAFVTAVEGLFDRLVGGFVKIGTAIADGDWRKALAGIGDVLAAPLKAIGDFIKGITTGFAPLDSLLRDVGNMFTDFGRIFQEVFQGDFSGAFEVFKRAIGRVPEIVTGAFTMIPWTTIGTALQTGIRSLPGYLSDTGTILLTKGSELLTGFLNGLNAQMPTITAWLSLLGSIAFAAVDDLSATLYSKGKQLLGGLWGGWNSVWTLFSEALALLGPNAAVAVDDVTEALTSKGTDLIGGLMSGWSTAWETAETTIGLLKVSAALAVGEVTATLESKGKDLIGGLMTGWISAWTLAKLTVESLKSVVSAAVGELGMTLWGHGQDLVQGLIDGITSMIPGLEAIANVIAGIVSGAVAAKNRIMSPSRLMMEMGGYIGEGLAIGIERSLPQVQTAANAMAAAASVQGRGSYGAGGVGGGYGGRGLTNQNNYGTIINEAPRHPSEALDNYSIARSRG